MRENVKYLAIDASTEACSVALLISDETSDKANDDKIISRYELCPQSHSLVLLPMVDEVLKEANCKVQDLDGLIFGRGPGSFTGVRIGIGVAQGLAFSAELPVVGVSTLQAMAQLAYENSGETSVLAAIDARMSEVYTGYFKLDPQGLMQPVIDEAVLSPSLLMTHYHELPTPVYVVGTGWDAYSTVLEPLKVQKNSPTTLFPDARAMLKIGIDAFDKGLGVSAEEAQPVYVRDTVSWKKLPGR